MSYSYCSSELNRRFYISPVTPTLLLQCYPHIQSQNDTSLAYSSSIELPLPNRKRTKPSTFTLSYFRSLFNDHRRPSVTMYHKDTMWNYFNILKNLLNQNSTIWYSKLCYSYFRYVFTISDFYKDTIKFSFYQIFF